MSGVVDRDYEHLSVVEVEADAGTGAQDHGGTFHEGQVAPVSPSAHSMGRRLWPGRLRCGVGAPRWRGHPRNP